VDRGHDLALLVAHYPHLLEVDAERGEVFGDIADVLVLGAAGQYLVADHQHGGGDGAFGCGGIGDGHRGLAESTRRSLASTYPAIEHDGASSHPPKPANLQA